MADNVDEVLAEEPTLPGDDFRTVYLQSEAMRLGIFIPEKYRMLTGLDGSSEKLFAGLLGNGGKPPKGSWNDFDADFYLNTYVDVKNAAVNPLEHYISNGLREGRYPSLEKLRADVDIVEKSGVFDYRGYGSKLSAEARRQGLVEHYLTLGWRDGMRGIHSLDDQFYFETYKGVMEPFFVPAVHYLLLGLKMGLPSNAQEFSATQALVEGSGIFDFRFYSLKSGQTFSTLKNAVRHYLSYGILNSIPCSPEFNQALYLKQYPDLQACHVLPVTHYIQSGKAEGRLASIDSSEVFKPGAVSLDSSKKNLLVVCHEASATGAPLLGLALIKDLSKEFNIITLLHKGGALVEEFSKYSVLFGNADQAFHQRYRFLLEDLQSWMPIDVIIANSIECEELCRAGTELSIPSLALLHEFAEYTRPTDKLADLATGADQIVAPAEMVKASFIKEVSRYFNGTPRQIDVCHQGRVQLPKKKDAKKVDEEFLASCFGLNDKVKPKIVLGAGYVQPRKGVDLFVQTAIALQAVTDDPIKFIWVGGGWNPNDDLTFSVWQQTSIQGGDIKDKILFIDELPDLDWVFEHADIFFLSSRLDPFPNVAIDAFTAGVPVVCFENATGISEFIKANSPSSRVVANSNCHEAAIAIMELCKGKKGIPKKELAGITKALDWQSYLDYLKAQIRFLDEREFDTDGADKVWPMANPYFGVFSDQFKMDPLTEKRYRVKRMYNGLLPMQIAPGFDPALGEELDESFAWDEPLEATHIALEVPKFKGAGAEEGVVSNKKIAIHLHMHYEDLSEELAARFEPFAKAADFYISTTAERKVEIIRDAFSEFASVKICAGPNVGRDVGPMLTTFREELSAGGYDILGHFHSKKSLETAGVDLGKKWRSYLYDSLVGDAHQAQWIIDQFDLYPDLGLLFPESRHIAGWNANYKYAQSLLERIGQPPMEKKLGVRYPLGTMVWGHPDIIKPYWEANLEADDFPKEPLPVDGSELHAFERLLPVLCERVGKKWLTVYRCDIEQW